MLRTPNITLPFFCSTSEKLVGKLQLDYGICATLGVQSKTLRKYWKCRIIVIVGSKILVEDPAMIGQAILR